MPSPTEDDRSVDELLAHLDPRNFDACVLEALLERIAESRGAEARDEKVGDYFSSPAAISDFRSSS